MISEHIFSSSNSPHPKRKVAIANTFLLMSPPPSHRYKDAENTQSSAVLKAS